MAHPDAWLFLPPEVEALVPALLARLAASNDDRPDSAVEKAELERIETLIVEGDVEAWREFLRVAARAVATYEGPDEAARDLLAAILDDQFILARAVVDLEPRDVAARSELAQFGDVRHD